MKESAMRRLAAVPIVLMAAGPSAGQDQACPMHAAHAAKRQAEVGHRHEHTTGVPGDGTRHHFLLAEDGGSIRLGVEDEAHTAAREAVREHLRAIARAFAEGDFSMPTAIHDRVPPGVDVMKARRDAIRYAYADTPAGGVVTIATDDAGAVAAVHEFLRFQIRDHGTGDPTE
jgi:hypothetical protein